MNLFEKSRPPVTTPTTGMIRSLTIDVTIVENAAADDHTNSEVHYVALQGKFLEFLEHAHWDSSLMSMAQ
jgi:hypothetical protein